MISSPVPWGNFFLKINKLEVLKKGSQKYENSLVRITNPRHSWLWKVEAALHYCPNFVLYARRWLKSCNIPGYFFFFWTKQWPPNYIKDKKTSDCFFVQNELSYDGIIVLVAQIDMIHYVCMNRLEIAVSAFGVKRLIVKVATPQMSQKCLTNSSRRELTIRVERKAGDSSALSKKIKIKNGPVCGLNWIK